MTKTLDPEKLTDREHVRNLLANAERLGEIDLAKACQRRLFKLSGMDFDDPLERRFWEIIAAFEEFRTQANGRTTKANRTRQKVNKAGIIKTVEDLMVQAQPSDGFKQLVAAGLSEFVFEHMVIEFPDRFSDKAVVAARRRLDELSVGSARAVVEG